MNQAPFVALVGNPNAGKSALFNALTGARQKVGNYPGVTVERKAGRLALADGRPVELVDLPGTYSLDPSSPDEEVTRNVVLGHQEGERQPDALRDRGRRHAISTIICASRCKLIELGRPTVDRAQHDRPRPARRAGASIRSALAARARRAGDPDRRGPPPRPAEAHEALGLAVGPRSLRARATIRAGVSATRASAVAARDRHRRRDRRRPARRLTHGSTRCCCIRSLGPLILLALLFLMFQAVFAWAAAPMRWIEDGVAGSTLVADALPDGLLRDLIVDGVIAGVGAVVVFLPQILILFLFILMLEATGYMARAAFLMDRLMASVGLSGRAFIPLLSSFACAIPGIMATRTHRRSRRTG